MCLLIFAGCGKTEDIQNPVPVDDEEEDGTETGGDEKEDPVPERVTFAEIIGDPAAYEVYIIDDEKIIRYDFTSYWTSATGGYYYFEDPLPSEDEYETEEFPIIENGWEEIVNVLHDEKFYKLPEDMTYDDVMDGVSAYIEVETDGETYFSGGYCAGMGTGKKHERYWQIKHTIMQVISDSYAEYKENYVYVPEPPSKSYFENLDPESSLLDVYDDIGVYNDSRFSAASYWYDWELDNGETASVMFDGNEEEILEIRIIDEEGFYVLYDKDDHVPTGVKFDFIKTQNYADQNPFFELASLYACTENYEFIEDKDLIEDYLIVSACGEEFDISEEDFERGIARRMSETELSEFYSEVLGVTKDSFTYRNTVSDFGNIEKIDDYLYAVSSMAFPVKYQIEFVSRNDYLYVVEGCVRNARNDIPLATVTLYLEPSDTDCGFTIKYYEYMIEDFSCLEDKNPSHDLPYFGYFENLDASVTCDRMEEEIGHCPIIQNMHRDLSWYGWYVGSCSFWVLYDDDDCVRQVRKECGGYMAILYDSEDEKLGDPGVMYDISDDDKYISTFSVIAPN